MDEDEVLLLVTWCGNSGAIRDLVDVSAVTHADCLTAQFMIT